jgi:hypothetical protein
LPEQPDARQSAQGSYIAQASEGSTAIVEYSSDQPRGNLRSNYGIAYSEYGVAYRRIQVFDPSEYLNNDAMIKKLHEEKEMALATLHNLQEKVTKSESSKHELELRNQRLNDALGEAGRSSVRIWFLHILAVLLFGFGINVITENPHFWLGWVLIGGAIVAEYVAFKSRFAGEVIDGSN